MGEVEETGACSENPCPKRKSPQFSPASVKSFVKFNFGGYQGYIAFAFAC